ncbi:MAG: hypothetical protein WEA34_03765 [Gemmatimonadota bacterium]
MQRIVGLRPVTVGSLLAAALMVGWVLSLPFQVHVGEKTLSGLEWEEPPSGAEAPRAGGPGASATERPWAGAPLALRMVDAGGVGIPADTAAWGTTYSHATHAFDHLTLHEPPWFDGEKASEVRADWKSYVHRMAGMGNNAVVLDAFLETINFDGVGSGREVYPATTPLRERHLAYRAFYDDLAGEAEAVGMDTYLKTDLPVVTPLLERYFREELEEADADDPRFWDVYAAAFDELFGTMPGIAGVVVRIGEAGPLFNVDSTEYASYMGVRTPAQLQLMLRTLLPVFERHGRTLIFRSWSVGLGPLGDLHHDPGTYMNALGAIASPALVVSTKFVAGDYFGFLPMNPTLLVGSHRRIIEYQARREYEGFGALPNYLGHAHREALHRVLDANPNVVGTSLWTQEGGPLRAGPLSLYDVTGFWLWTDANVYATSRLAVDPAADPRTLAVEWARATFDADLATATAVADVLELSREALEKALYVRPFARKRVELAGIEVPPILWIFEWDQVGGWSSVLSTLHRTVRDDADTAIAEGYEAVRLTRAMKDRLLSLEPSLGHHPDWPDLLRSLEYQVSLYETLAEFWSYFLGYYRWLEEGGDAARWRSAGERFLSAAREHDARFVADLDFPAFHFGGAVDLANRTMSAGSGQTAAGVLLLALGGLLVLGARPVRRLPWAGWSHAGVVAGAVFFTAALLFPGSLSLGVGVAALVLTFSATLALSLRGPWRGDGPHPEVAASVGPLLSLAALVLSVIAVRGPDYFWLRFWMTDPLRVGLFAAAIASMSWSLVSSYGIGHRVSGCRLFAAGSVLVASGTTLVGLSVVLPDIETTLTALDEPFRLLPMTTAIVNGVTHYAGVPDMVLRIPGIFGFVLLVAGFGLQRRGSPGIDR